MTDHATVIRYVVEALCDSHKIHLKTGETYTSPECRSRLYRGLGPPDAPVLQDGTHLGVSIPETIMFGDITQEYNRI
jgi:hypothetical protein